MLINAHKNTWGLADRRSQINIDRLTETLIGGESGDELK